MGGTALAKFGFESRRISAKEYQDIIAELEQTVRSKGLSGFAPILSYSNKPDHGDVDCVLLQYGNTIVDYSEIIKGIFNPQYISQNHNTVSFDYKGVQIDISCFRNEEDLWLHTIFCDYSPFGNIYARLLKQFGLKWGLGGLEYPVKLSDSEQLGDIFISGDIHEILEFGGLNPIRKFREQTDIFETVYSSPYFNKEIYLLENLNHINRTRDRKRKDYHQWLEWIKDKESKFVRDPDKSVYIDKISDFFKINVHQKINDKVARHSWIKTINSKCNGSLIQQLTNLKGAELGAFLKKIKLDIAGENNEKWLWWVSKTPQQDINTLILERFNNL